MTDVYDPGGYTVDEVKAYVEANPDQRAAVTAAEQAGKARTTLLDWLSAGEPEQLVTTTNTKDYLNRALVNAVPGTSQATDYLGRSVITANRDYMARNLIP